MVYMTNLSSKQNNSMIFPPTECYCYKPTLNFGKKKKKREQRERDDNVSSAKMILQHFSITSLSSHMQ